MKKLLSIILLNLFLTISAQSGNVGINTDTPTHTLDVNGTLRIRKIEQVGPSQSAKDSIMVFDADGVVKYVSANAVVSHADAGSAKVLTDTTLTGDGSTGNVLKIAQQGAISGQVLTWNGSTWIPLNAAPVSTSNVLSTSGNTITSNVNGITSTAPAVNTVSNSITSGQLTTTVNGVNSTAITLPIADGSETKVNAGTNISVTGSGTTASPYVINNTFTEVDGSTTNELNTAVSSSGNTLTVTDAGGSKTAPIVNNNTLSLSGSTLTSNVNGVTTTQDLSSIVAGNTTNTISTSGNTITSNVNGITSTAPAVNNNTLSLSGSTLTSNVNGVTTTQDLSSIVAGNTTNTISTSGNTITSNVNGITSTAPAVNNNTLSLTGSTLTSNVNGVTTTQDLSSIVAGNTTNTISTSGNIITSNVNGVTSTAPAVNNNTISTSGNTITSNVNGITSTAPAVNNNTLSLSGSTLTSNVNGVTTTQDLSSIVAGNTTNTISTSGNTITSNVNGITSTAPAVNNNTLSLTGSTLTSNVNGVTTTQDLSSIVAGNTTNTISTSGNTITSNVNGITSTAPAVNNNTLSTSGNTITSNVNGITSTAPIVNSISNSITSGQLTTTVNGVNSTAITLPTADGSETKVNAGTNISVTGSGTTASPYVINNTFTEVDGSTTNELNTAVSSSGNTLTVTDAGGSLTTPIVNNNTLSLSGSTLTSNVNGVTTTQDLSSIVAGNTTNTLSTSGNTITSNVNGITSTAPAVNTVSNSITSGQLTTTVNGVNSTAITLPTADGSETKVNAGTNISVTGSGTTANPYVINNTFTEVDGSITNELNTAVSSSGNTLTVTDAGGSLTTPIVNNNTLSLSGSTLTSNVNGVTTTQDLSSIVAGNTTNTISTSGNTITSNVNGITSTAPAVNTVSNSITSGQLTTTVNGVNSTAITLPTADGSETKVNAGTNISVTGSGTTASPYVINNTFTEVDGSTTNELNTAVSSSGNTLTVTDAGGSKTAPIVNSISNSITSGQLTTTVNGVNSTAITLPTADGSETKVNAGTNISVTGSGTTASPYVINNTYSLPVATSSVLGGVKVGSGLNVAVDGTISTINNGTVTNVSGTTPISVTNGTTTPTISLTRNNLNTAASSSSATSPLTVTNGTNAVVNGADTSLAVNNTAPLWNANQLQSVNVSATTPTTNQILSYNSALTQWEPKTNTAWDILGNTGTNAANHFLGTTDANDLVFRTNNVEKARLFSLANPSLGIGRTTLTGVNGGASSYSGPTVFLGNAGNFSSPTGLDFIIDDDNNATNSQFIFKANGDGATGTIELMQINENGNVGIGLPTAGIATAKLHTLGTVRFEGLGTNTTNTNILTTDANGNVTTRTMGSLVGSSVLASAPITATTTANDVTLGLTRNNLNSGTSSNTATSALTITNGTNAVVNGADTSLTINNTAPLWNANQLQGIGLSTTAPTNGQVLKYNGTTWAPTVEAAASNWLITGNSNTTSSNFLGTTNDVLMSIRSNNTSMLEFGRRQTVGLYDSSSTGLFPYNQPDASVTYVRGTGGVSALQFEASGASFYKPILFTDSNGNFMMRGSSAATDFFELGSAGASNAGQLLFTIGDDGDEPMIFRKYNYSPAGYVEMMRLQGTGLNNSVRAGINVNGSTPNSTLQVSGSVSAAIASISAATTLDETYHTVILTNNSTITLPAASSCKGRIYIIKKTSTGTATISAYLNSIGTSSTTIPNGVVQLQSDGTSWQQIN